MRLCIALLVLGALARAEDPPIDQAFEQLMRDDQQSAVAERTLKQHPDRAAVAAEAERLLADDKTSIRAKGRVLMLCSRLERGDLVRKALEAPLVSTQRAAAQLLAGTRDAEEATKPILLAWIAEESPPDVALLVEACRKAKFPEAGPWLRKILEAPDTPPQAFADALAALLANPSPDIAEIVKEHLADAKEDPTRIEACIDALSKFPDMNVDDLLLPWLKQRDARIARLKAVHQVRDPSVLRQFLLDKSETDSIFQRNCLFRLMQSLDDGALLELLRNPRVNRHSYFAIRVDVCTALAAVEGSGAKDVPLLLDYLVDEDPQDKTHIVRSEAWLTLWTLTGRMHGAEGDFAKPPGCGGREYRATRMRPGVTPAQRKEAEDLAKDLGHMRKVREAYATAR